jgi:hypothetical protein
VHGFEICYGVLDVCGVHTIYEYDVVGISEIMDDIMLFEKLKQYFCYDS